MKHIVFLSLKDLKDLEDGKTIVRELDGAETKIVRADSTKDAHAIIESEEGEEYGY